MSHKLEDTDRIAIAGPDGVPKGMTVGKLKEAIVPGNLVDRIDHIVAQVFAIFAILAGLWGLDVGANLKVVETEVLAIVAAVVPLYHALYAIGQAVMERFGK